MQTELPERFSLPPQRGDSFPLRVSVIYEDSHAGLRAKEQLERLTDNMNLEPGSLDIRLWSFEALAEPGLRSVAAREAVDSEIILFSAGEGGEPPATVKEWALEWSQSRSERPCALAVLVEEQAHARSGANLLLNYLGDFARANNLDLVYPFRGASIRPADQAITASSLFDERLNSHESYPRWGINE